MSWTLVCPCSTLANVSAAVQEELRSLLPFAGTNPERTVIQAGLDSFNQCCRSRLLMMTASRSVMTVWAEKWPRRWVPAGPW